MRAAWRRAAWRAAISGFANTGGPRRPTHGGSRFGDNHSPRFRGGGRACPRLGMSRRGSGAWRGPGRSSLWALSGCHSRGAAPAQRRERRLRRPLRRRHNTARTATHQHNPMRKDTGLFTSFSICLAPRLRLLMAGLHVRYSGGSASMLVAGAAGGCVCARAVGVVGVCGKNYAWGVSFSSLF